MFLLHLILYQGIVTKICPASKKNIKSIKKFLRKNDEIKKPLSGPENGALTAVVLVFRVLWIRNPADVDPADAQRSLSDCSPP